MIVSFDTSYFCCLFVYLFIGISYTNKQRNPKTKVIHKKCEQVCVRCTRDKVGKGGSIRLPRKDTLPKTLDFESNVSTTYGN